MVVYLGMKISPISFAKAAHRARNQTNRANALDMSVLFFQVCCAHFLFENIHSVSRTNLDDNLVGN